MDDLIRRALLGDVEAQTCPELGRLISEAVAALRKEQARSLPKYEYPDHVVTAALLQKYSKYGVEWQIRRGECTVIAALVAGIGREEDIPEQLEICCG